MNFDHASIHHAAPFSGFAVSVSGAGSPIGPYSPLFSPSGKGPRYQWFLGSARYLTTVHHLSTVIYPDFPEAIEVFADKAMRYPEGFHILVDTEDEKFLAEEGEEVDATDFKSLPTLPFVAGYCFSHPYYSWTVPPLDQLFDERNPLPCERRDKGPGVWYYIHDCAISPCTRGSGCGNAIVKLLISIAADKGYSHMSLTSVKGSSAFWAKQGFEALTNVSGKKDEDADDSAANLRTQQLRLLEKLADCYGEDAIYMVKDMTPLSAAIES